MAPRGWTTKLQTSRTTSSRASERGRGFFWRMLLAMADQTGEISRFLGEMRAGDKAAESRLMEAVYPQLRRIAAKYLRQERLDHTLQATALVNEAYLQLL